MKKFLLTILMTLIFGATAAGASPFLICDPQKGAETYNVTQDGVILVTDHPAEADGSLRFDLEGLAPGAYTFRAAACTEPWGCSEESDPYLSPEPVNSPTGLSLTR